jgi:quercetin dioxygenase-like cupin family protein
MAIEVFPGHFTDRSDALARIEASGLYVREADIEPADLSGPAHGHPYDVEIYVLGGLFELTDCDAGVTHRLEQGWKAIVPADTRHAEFSPDGFSAVFGLSIDPEPLLAERAARHPAP